MIKRLILIFLLPAVNVWGYSVPITSFNSGQVSPLLEARGDFAKYSSSSRLLENMLVTSQGPVLKRPGTKYIASAKEGSPRLIPFEHSTDDAYVLEVGNEYMRFYRDGAQILTETDGSPVEISTVYATGGFFDIQYAQTDDSMYLVDGTNRPQILTRADHDDWTITDVVFETGPFLTENDTDITITPSAATGFITLTASGDTFDSGHVGSLWQINQIRSTSQIDGTFTANINGPSLSTPFFTGGYGFTTSGIWVGTVTLQRSTDAGISWRAALTPLVNTNFDNPGEFEEDGAIYRVVMSNHSTGTCTYAITITDNLNRGVVTVTSFTSATVVDARVINDLVDTTATAKWREGSWSDFRGWPTSVAFHQQRLVFAGSLSNPQTLWFGKQDPDDYANFREGTLDTSSFTAALEGQNPIRWLLSQDYLLIGSSGSCGKYGEQGGAITPTTPAYQEQTKFGAAAIPAILGGDAVLYVERGSRTIREFGYSLQYDKYLAPPLTIFSPEITESGIKNVAFQLRPNPVLWCVLNDGEISTLTYDRAQEVLAWSKQVTDGDFESITVISSGEDEDEVWVSVKREIDGSDVRYIEQFQPQDWGSDQADAWFVDAGATLDLGAVVTVTDVTDADPGVVTAAAHGFSNGDQVTFESVVGMIELNGRVYTVSSKATNTFELKDSTGAHDYDTSDFTEYISGGTVQQVENAFGGLSYLEGETVAVYADGTVQETELVSAGITVIDVFSNVTTIGLPFTSRLETLPLRIDPQDMTLNKRIEAVYIDFYKTANCKYASRPSDELTTINFWEGATVNAYQDLYTSVVRPKKFLFVHAKMMKATVYLEDANPSPLGVRSITPEINAR